MVLANVRYLHTHGPSPVADLPNRSVTVQDKQNGVVSFSPSLTSAPGGSKGRQGQTKTVYYLDSHDRRAVVLEWVQTNPHVPDGVSVAAFHNGVSQVGPEFSDVAREVTIDVYGQAAWDDEWRDRGGKREGKTMAERLEDMDPSDVFGDE